MKRVRGLVWALVLAGCSRSPEPEKPPAMQGPAPAAASAPVPPALAQAEPAAMPALDFAAYGDCRSGHAVHRRICASMLRSGAKAVVVSGDLVDWGDDEDDWKVWREITGELRSKTAYLAAPGNHDVSRTRAFERELGLDRTWFDRRVGDVHVFLLDSNQEFEDAAQLEWLEKTAAASDARHKVAAFHHPAYSLSAWGDLEERPIRQRLHPLLVKLKFCAAFAGHHHSFYATRRDGLRYVVTAGGGAHLYRQQESLAVAGDLFRSFHHFVGCNVSEKGIRARVFDPDGREAPELAFQVCEHP
jgi:3',5'-cyclic AMP phosphodiesterase CpdA